MRLLQGLILAVVVLDATLVMTSSISSPGNVEQVTASESTLGPNAVLMASR